MVELQNAHKLKWKRISILEGLIYQMNKDSESNADKLKFATNLMNELETMSDEDFLEKIELKSFSHQLREIEIQTGKNSFDQF